MARTVIVSEETARGLVEAHASMAAWYYQLAEALRRAGAGVEPPSDEQRRAHLEPLAAHFPELATVVASITTPRPYVPPPAISAPCQVVENEGVEVRPPPADHIAAPALIEHASEPGTVGQPRSAGPAPGPPPCDEQPSASQVPPAPPPLVDPSKVRYE